MIDLAIRHAFAELTVDVAFRTQSRALALFGDSGAGKTTVLNAIAGLLHPQQGRIVLDGRVLFDSAQAIDVAIGRRRIGYVFQDGRLFPHLSVAMNLLYGAHSRKVDVTLEFERVIGLLDLQPLLRRRPENLSGGERQRVAIGRALLSAPEILLLDEPLTGLHRGARDQVLDYLRRLKRELRVATLLVTHHPDEVVALADEVVLMQAGSVTGQLDIATFALEQTREGSARPARPTG